MKACHQHFILRAAQICDREISCMGSLKQYLEMTKGTILSLHNTANIMPLYGHYARPHHTNIILVITIIVLMVFSLYLSVPTSLIWNGT